MSAVQLSEICLGFDKGEVLRGLNLAVESGEYVVVLGASGCGKTSLLRMVAGLIRPTSGTIFFDGVDMSAVPARRRGVALVPQHAGLYPHLSVGRSIGLGIQEKLCQADREHRIREAARIVEIESELDRLPEQLSGGQLRRAAVAKAIASRSRVRLLDEPLSAIDANLRFQIERDLLRLHQETPGVTIHVTHDGAEARRLADRLAVIEDGKIAQCDSPEKVLAQPASPAVAAALGDSSLAKIKLRKSEQAWVTDEGQAIQGPDAASGATAVLAYYQSDVIPLAEQDVAQQDVTCGGDWCDPRRNVLVKAEKLFWFLD